MIVSQMIAKKLKKNVKILKKEKEKFRLRLSRTSVNSDLMTSKIIYRQSKRCRRKS